MYIHSIYIERDAVHVRILIKALYVIVCYVLFDPNEGKGKIKAGELLIMLA